MSDIDFDKRLEELFENFRRQLPERLRTILEAWRLYLETEQTPALEDLRFHIHKLAGAASTYGFTEIGDNARQIETRLDDYLQQGVSTGIETELQPRIDHIKELIDNC
jgi:HPt (histidine-containing phosphotransfer) domain-containing protein